jgi:DNA-binding NtrC family response regulator
MLPLLVKPDPLFQESEAMLEVRRRARRFAMSDLPLVIEGELGTGRRSLASDVVLQRSSRSRYPVLAVNTVAELLTEIRLARRSQPPDVLLYNLEFKSSEEQFGLVDLVRRGTIRLVAVATSENAEGERPNSALSRQLQMELSATHLLLPALRVRGDDVARWTEFFLSQAAEGLGRPCPSISTGAMAAIRRHHWPGNLIELDVTLRRALCLSASDILDATSLELAEAETSVQPLAEAIDRFRIDYINRVLAQFSGNRTQAAKALNVDVRTIFRYLEKE